MRNPYNEVLAAFPRRLLRRGTGMWLLIGTVVQLPAVMLSGHEPTNPGAACLCVSMASLYLWFHVREQLVSTRRRLIPGYVAPHLTGFVFYAFLLIGGLVALSALSGENLQAILICELAVFALAGLTVAYASVWLGIVNFLAIFGAVTFGPVCDRLWRSLCGEARWLTISLVMLALLAAAWALAKMLRLTEEDRPYNARIGFDQSALRPRMTGVADNASAPRLDRLRPIVVMPRDASTWRRGLAWGRLVRGNMHWGMLFAYTLLILGYSFVRLGFPAHDSPPEYIVILLVYYFPMMMPQFWMTMWRYLEADSLRPASREQFLKEHAVAIITSQLMIWSLLVVGFVIYLGVLGRDLPFTTTTWLLGGSLVMQIPIFAGGVWLLRFRSVTAQMVFIMLQILIVCAMTLPSLDGHNFPAMLPYLIACWLILTTLGIFLARDAWRRWLTTELG
ncbi:MAG: hypothetical protein ABSH22_07465 [Tepidisphaeraceae bacterium]